MSAETCAYSQIIPVEIGDVIKPTLRCNQVAPCTHCLCSLLAKESQDSNIFRKIITDGEGRHDVSFVLVNAWSFDAARYVGIIAPKIATTSNFDNFDIPPPFSANPSDPVC